jgi:hypothetical protein
MILKSPLTQLQEVLYELLSKESISVKQMMADTGILNIKARISDLRLKYNLSIDTEMVKVQNKYGRKVSFGQWRLTDKETALLTYKKLQEDDKLK